MIKVADKQLKLFVIAVCVRNDALNTLSILALSLVFMMLEKLEKTTLQLCVLFLI